MNWSTEPSSAMRTADGDPPERFPSAIRRRLEAHYDRMWSATIDRIRTGSIQPDPVLASGLADRRRGLTVIARPSLDVRQRVADFLDELRMLEPDQHYYARSEFHLTVLSLFTATVQSGRFLARTPQYVAAVDSALHEAAPFRIEFGGVTASPDAILIQGFLEDDLLNRLRDRLRRDLRSRGLADGLDGRYRLETAHLTVVRFRAGLRDGELFAAALENARHRIFGTTTIERLTLVRNDWYMTRGRVETVRRYRLSNGARGATEHE